jgi:hypothetical protein
VIFDYTVWSSFGTARVQDFADARLGPVAMFRTEPDAENLKRFKIEILRTRQDRA